MATRLALASVLLMLALGVACSNGGVDISAPMGERETVLAEMVLQTQDVPPNFTPGRAEPVSNDFFAAQLSDRYGLSPGELPEGRLNGYLSSFLDHPAYVTNRVDLFGTDAQAAAFLAAPLTVSLGPAFVVPGLGDDALAYPLGRVSREGCPCIIRFRQGNAVAEVYFEGRGATGELEDVLSLARKVEQRVAAALDR